MHYDVHVYAPACLEYHLCALMSTHMCDYTRHMHMHMHLHMCRACIHRTAASGRQRIAARRCWDDLTSPAKQSGRLFLGSISMISIEIDPVTLQPPPCPTFSAAAADSAARRVSAAAADSAARRVSAAAAVAPRAE